MGSLFSPTPDERIFRRLNPNKHFAPNADDGGYRISSAAFKPKRGDKVSVDRESLTPLDVERVLVESIHPGYGIGALKYSEANDDQGVTIEANALPDNPGHCLLDVKGNAPRRLAKLCKVVDWPTAPIVSS